MGNRRKGLSVRQAATVTGMSESTVRRWADNSIAEQAGDPLPHPTRGRLKAWRTAGARGRGHERRIDEDDAERVRRENAGEPAQ